MGYETKFTFEENPEMFAAEYLARHFTEGVRPGGVHPEDEKVMFEVLELIEDHDSLEQVVLGLEGPYSQTYFYNAMDSEIKWCEETLASELKEDPDMRKNVLVLKEAYEIAVNYMQEMSAL